MEFKDFTKERISGSLSHGEVFAKDLIHNDETPLEVIAGEEFARTLVNRVKEEKPVVPNA